MTTLSTNAVTELARQYHEDRCDGWTVLMVHDGKVICRVPQSAADIAFDSDTVILKLWSQGGVRQTFRYLTRTRPVDRELTILSHLDHTSIRVPQLLGSCWIKDRSVPFSQAVVLEDLGETQRALEYYKDLREAGRTEEMNQLEERMLTMTEGLLDHHVVDPDHGFVNSVMTPAGELVRIDFEVARIVKDPRSAKQMCGQMLGRTLVTFAYAVQPDVERLDHFANELTERMDLSRESLQIARDFIDDALNEQQQQTGIDLSWTLVI